MIDGSSLEDKRDRLVALTRDMILIPSIPSRPDDRQRAFEFIKNHIESVGNVKVQEFVDQGIPSMVAMPAGISVPDILMLGHLDVITHPDVSVYRSVIKEGRIIGPGAGDMKGSLAILMEVFRTVHTNYPNASLGIAVTSDEEVGGASGVGLLFNEKEIRCKIAMIPDGGSINKITIEEKGILHLNLKCEGKSAHAARPWLGDNPINRLMDKLQDLRQHFDA